MRSFPEILKEERKKGKLTQTALAEKISCDRYRIADLERGKSSPSVEDLNLLCDYFEVSADYLLGRTPVRAPDPDKTLDVIWTYTGLSESAIAALHLPGAPLSWWDEISDEGNKTDRYAGYDGFVNSIIETGVLHHTAQKARSMENAADEQSCRLAAFEAVEIFQRFIADRRDEILKKLLGGAENKEG